ncbi:hypothetical protein [uncultured Winogradskyella sp.]|uniref:hypothetical protein n=1 Tax=uncultured Winogradskyella sp. TaxID=395353 RepID=UPI00263146B7|nr:hypothetical protein [uncultured Winogradskyella sp.]
MILKKNLSLIFLIFFLSILNAQESGEIIKLTADVPVDSGATIIGVTTNIDTANNNRIYLEAGYKYKIIRITSNIVELRAINFDDTSNWFSSDSSDAENQKKISEYNGKIYTISRVNFDRFYEGLDLTKKNDRISIGILSLPFKARPDDNLGFDTEFNFNSTVSFKLGSFLGTSFNIQLGAGIGTVGLNESNTSYTGEGTIQPQDVSTLTILTGLMLQYERVQVGLYLGWDHINNQSVFNWQSNGDKWIGFGVGFSVFKVNLGKREEQNN